MRVRLAIFGVSLDLSKDQSLGSETPQDQERDKSSGTSLHLSEGGPGASA